MLECPNCENYLPTTSFLLVASPKIYKCRNCGCAFELNENGRYKIVSKPIPHIFFVCLALLAAFVSGFFLKADILFLLFLGIAFFINVYSIIKVKIVYDVRKICLLSTNLSASDAICAFIYFLVNIIGFGFIAFKLFQMITY